MSERIQTIVILTPAPGKIDALIETLKTLTSLVESNEPKTLEYRMYRSTQKDTGVEQIVFTETYENQEAQDNHRNTEYFAAVTKKAGEEKLLAAPLDVRVIKAVGGFSLRG